MFNLETFRANVRELLREQNETQAAAADAAGISPSAFSKMLNSGQNVTAEILFKLADHFGVSVDFLGGGEGSRIEGLTCRNFCRILVELSERGQLQFTETEHKDDCCGFDPSRGEWTRSPETNKYYALILPCYEDLPDPMPGDENFILANRAVNTFLGCFVPMSKSAQNWSEDNYNRTIEALLNEVPANRLLLQKKG